MNIKKKSFTFILIMVTLLSFSNCESLGKIVVNVISYNSESNPGGRVEFGTLHSFETDDTIYSAGGPYGIN